MRLIKIKEGFEKVLNGVEISEVCKNSSGVISSITIKDRDGNLIKLMIDGFNEIAIYVKEPPKKVKKYVVSCNYMIADDVIQSFSKTFEEKSEAEKLYDKLNNDLATSELKLDEIEEVVE